MASPIIKKEQGLLSNTCKYALFDANIVWVAADLGISRIDYRWHADSLRYTLSAITEDDGLGSNDVNQLAIAGKWLWAATARGVSFLSKDYISTKTSQPPVKINRIVAGNKEVVVSDTINIDYRKNSLVIDLSGISFRSGKNVYCEYRLNNLDSNWHAIANNLVSFPSLPFGELAFEVRAVDRWDEKTDPPRKLIIINTPPFWKSGWFAIIVYVVSIFFIALLFFIYHRMRQRKKEAAYQVNKKIRDLEMMALRAQMNPHFIFNCLSSIQHYILRSDVANANLYLHKFSTLIRKILQHSNSPAISLSEELKILEVCLELENDVASLKADMANLIANRATALQSADQMALTSITPNPAGSNATFRYFVPSDINSAQLHIYNLQGVEVVINCFRGDKVILLFSPESYPKVFT